MTLDFIYPTLPPHPRAIGEYTALLAQTLGREHEVRILVGVAGWDPVPGVTVEYAYDRQDLQSVLGLADTIARRNPDGVVLQYNPFSYGTWGWNPYVPRLFRRLRKRCPDVLRAVMVHEDLAVPMNWRLATMNLWQWPQFIQLGRTADCVFVAIDAWVTRYQRWLGSTPLVHLPVGSNIPYCGVTRAQAREHLGLSADTLVLGVFGTAHATRLLHFVAAAAARVQGQYPEQHPDICLLYIGPDGSLVRQALGAVPMLDLGRVPAEEVSRGFAAMDIYLAPFRKGVSARRGSFLVALQHGVPTVSTDGPHTDMILKAQNGRSFVLVDEQEGPEQYARAVLELVGDPERKRRLAEEARQFYTKTMDWSVLAQSMVEYLTPSRLQGHPAKRRSPSA